VIHGPAIYKRICDLLAETGGDRILGLKTISFGDLRLIPADETKLAAWLPALLVVIPAVRIGDWPGDDLRGPQYQMYPVDLYLFRRYQPNEVTALEMWNWMAQLELVFTRRDWRDRMQRIDAGLLGNAKLKSAKIVDIDFNTEGILETREELIAQLSAAVMHTEIRLLAFSGDLTDRKET